MPAGNRRDRAGATIGETEPVPPRPPGGWHAAIEDEFGIFVAGFRDYRRERERVATAPAAPSLCRLSPCRRHRICRGRLAGEPVHCPRGAGQALSD